MPYLLFVSDIVRKFQRMGIEVLLCCFHGSWVFWLAKTEINQPSLLTLLSNFVAFGNMLLGALCLNCRNIYNQFVAAFFAGPLNLADVCILRSGVKCQYRRLFAFYRLNWDFKSPRLKDGLYLWSKCQVSLDMALNDFNSRQFKTGMKKMTAQVYFWLFF